MVDISKISTEKRNLNTMDIDSLSTLKIIERINEEDKKVPLSIEKTLPQIASLIDRIVLAFENGGRLIYAGAGTSGRIGVLDASECPPTYGTDPDMVIALIAGGKKAMLEAVEGAEDSINLAKENLMNLKLNDKDVVIGIAASGRTPYAIGAVEYANEVGACSACITTSFNSPIAKIVKYPIEALTGAEPITGSTRMKSGTAQKLILNMISTAAMIRMGKVYKNLMIDVQQKNKKLVSRAIFIVSEVTGVSEEEARKYLEKYKEVKPTIFTILTEEENIEIINRFLNQAKGHLRKAMSLYKENKISSVRGADS